VLINTLSDSKITSGVINGRVAEAEETNKQINTTRLTYVPAAERGSIIYFTIADLALIGEMYQFSLEYFNALFLVCIQKSEKSPDLEVRLGNVMKYASFQIYANCSRALFGEHKITFSFMLTTAIMRKAGKISAAEWQLFLVGAGIVDESKLPACPDGIDMAQWVLICTISERVDELKDFGASVKADVSAWRPLMDCEAPWDETTRLPAPLGEDVSSFQKLLVVKCFRPEKIIDVVGEFIAGEMGREYIEQPPLDLHTVFPDTNNATPIVFVLSTGADPMSTIVRFATEKSYLDRMHAISLGQGQGPIAAALIEKSSKKGDWVVLQNCHLAKSWMPKLEKIVEGFPIETTIHDDFRLWLTSMPAKYFPTPVLQTSCKLTFEPPKGMRANLIGTWAAMTQADFENIATKPYEWKKLLFGLTFFHAVVQERRKFGPLGWNIRYDFNATDMEICMQTLRMFLDEQPVIPWDALLYLSGQIHYGGRVTDSNDKGTLLCILKAFYTPEILKEGYQFANDSDTYHSPPDGDLESYRAYVASLPYTDSVGIFGLHANAKITFEKQESDKLLTTVTDIQPALGGGGAGASAEDTVQALASQLAAQVPDPMDRKDAGDNVFALNAKGELNSIQIVLLHEMGRFNKLLKRIKTSLKDLGNAIKGLVVMSSELDAMFGSMLKNQVPALWTKVAYPSLKPLSGWMKDLLERVTFFSGWLRNGQPACFNLPAFFFQQGFMTGILQLHAREHELAIDTLSFSYKILQAENASEITEPPTSGVYCDGFFLVGARWDREKGYIWDSYHKVMEDTMPVVHFVPTQFFERNEADYPCPLYKTAVRAGVLTTTGASSNYVVSLDIPTERDPDYWVRMGVAALCALAE